MPLDPDREAEFRRQLEEVEKRIAAGEVRIGPGTAKAEREALNKALKVDLNNNALANALTLRVRGDTLGPMKAALVTWFDLDCPADGAGLDEVQRAFVDLAYDRATPAQQALALQACTTQSAKQEQRAEERLVETSADRLRDAAKRAGSIKEAETRRKVVRGLLLGRWPSSMIREGLGSKNRHRAVSGVSWADDGSLLPNQHNGQPFVGEAEMLQLAGYTAASWWKDCLYYPVPRGEFVDLCAACAPDWDARCFWSELKPALLNDANREFWAPKPKASVDRAPEQVSEMPRSRRILWEKPVALLEPDIKFMLGSPDLRDLLPRSLFAHFELELPTLPPVTDAEPVRKKKPPGPKKGDVGRYRKAREERYAEFEKLLEDKYSKIAAARRLQELRSLPGSGGDENNIRGFLKQWRENRQAAYEKEREERNRTSG